MTTAPFPDLTPAVAEAVQWTVQRAVLEAAHGAEPWPVGHALVTVGGAGGTVACALLPLAEALRAAPWLGSKQRRLVAKGVRAPLRRVICRTVEGHVATLLYAPLTAGGEA